MAERVFFQYRAGETLLHKMDARFKLLALILLCIAAFAGRHFSLLALTILTAMMVASCRIPAGRLIRDLRPVLLLVVLVVIARTLTGTGPSLVALGWVRLSREGLLEGASAGWRLLLVSLFSSLLVSTTRISHIRSAVARMAKTIAFLPESRIATMFGLTLGFIPLVMVEAQEISMAQKARCVESRRSPLYRISTLSLALLRRIFQRGENLALAMEARCYSDQATLPHLESRAADWVKLAAVGLIAAVILVFRL
jgi:biotin transport system permease protein